MEEPVMPNFKVDRLLLNHEMFRDILPRELEQLQKEVTRVGLEKGQTLFHKGDMAQGAYIVVYGIMKLSISSEDGGEKILEMIRPGQNFGEAMIFLDEPYPFSAIACDNVMLLRISPHGLLQLMDQSPRIARQMMTGLSTRLLSFIRNLERHCLQNATQRVIEYLLQASVTQSTTQIKLDLKKNLVASLLNLAPSTLSRILHQLTDLELIKVRGSSIHIASPDQLKSFQQGPAMLY
jgi:CRP/FNR family transcriptional regulator, dissimilatory nitrate respiration regulator